MMGEDKGICRGAGRGGIEEAGRARVLLHRVGADNLFQISPKMSYPPESWVKAEPDFWKPKAAVAAVKKAETKPAQ